MSWIKDAASGTAPPPYTDPPEAPKVKDPSIPNRMVVDKPANRPFLAHREYRERQEALHKAWEERQKEREAKIARGEKVGPPEQDPTAQIEIGLFDLLKFLVYLLIFAALAGKFITGSYTWDYEGKWIRLKTYWPKTNQRLFSESFLAQFDGKIEGRPIYLAIDGDVYDVTGGKAYQPGGSYAILAGVDAARAFGTGCFKDHRTHDTRGMLDSELRSLAHWKKFYEDHKDYVKIGRVSHPPIDPASPIPVHCDPKKQEAVVKAAKEKADAARKEAEKDAHEEL